MLGLVKLTPSTSRCLHEREHEPAQCVFLCIRTHSLVVILKHFMIWLQESYFPFTSCFLSILVCWIHIFSTVPSSKIRIATSVLSVCLSFSLSPSPSSVTYMFNSHLDENLSHTQTGKWIFQPCKASRLQRLSPLQRRKLFRFILTLSWNIECLVKSMNLLFLWDVIPCMME